MRRSTRAALAGTGLALSLVAGLATTTGGPAAGAAAAAPDPYGTVWNILPPGSNGTATSLDLVGVGPDREADAQNPPNFADQLEMYDALTEVEPGTLTDADIAGLFKPAGFEPDEVVETSTPREGVTIERDAFGVPYITGVTFEDVEFGAGYAATEDRMFLMDALRHAGAARLAEFAGDTPGNVAMDRNQLRSAYYTEEEAEAQIATAGERAGEDGARLLAGVDAFLEGINAAQADLCPVVAAPTCPVEYAALQRVPEDWTRADIVYLASLVGGIFGKGGGHEYDNAIFLQRLTTKYGARKAQRIYRDLRSKNDPEAPTTAETFTPYQRGAVDPTKPGVALPDVDGPTAPGSGDPADGGADDGAPAEGTARMDLPGYSIEVPLEGHGMSNALLVGAEHTGTGHPLAVMGPQTSYFTPQLLVEQVLDGPGIKARGVAFAGTNLFVQLGRGVDYAWSATSSGSDNIDTVAERLCNTDGSEPTVDSTGYRTGGTCVEMEQFTHSETTLPGAGSQEPPKTYEWIVLRTRHGLVQKRTTVDGKPVAIVSQRSTYGHEVDSVIGFSQLNDPGFVTDADSFQQAAGNIDYTFNWFYADSEDISYYSSGLLPRRAKGVDGDLPRWGTRRYDWQGWLSFGRHPRQTNPEQGYLVSWNNKQAPGFAASDAEWGYGSVYRSLALEDRVRDEIAEGDVDLAEGVGIMSAAATTDSRAAYTLPWLLRAIGKDPATRDARALLRGWLADGAPRVDRDRDGAYAHQQAIALFDHWWQHGTKGSVAYDVMKGGVGRGLVRKVPVILDDHPRHGMGSAWNGVPWYGWISKDLRTLLGRDVEGEYSRGYCGGGVLRDCRATLRASLAKAVEQVLAEQEVASVEALTYDKHQDDIRHSTAGVVGVRPIDWQNRPTFQQVLEFTGHR